VRAGARPEVAARWAEQLAYLSLTHSLNEAEHLLQKLIIRTSTPNVSLSDFPFAVPLQTQ
jgi:hypothetical protein